MNEFVLIKQGTYRNKPINGVIFKLVQDIHRKANKKLALVVDGSFTKGFPNSKFTIYISNPSDYEKTKAPKSSNKQLSDVEIRKTLKERFEFFGLLVDGACEGKIRSLIISGGAGVGKSYTAEYHLKENAIYDALAWDADSSDEEVIRRTECDRNGNKKFQPKYTILKGAISPVILFATLFKYSNAGEILVLDDCDSIFWDVDSLNILKAALDSGSRRVLTYSKDSHILKERGVPTKFEYKGSVIFITNLDFEAYCNNKPNSSIVPHLKALLSRTHYLNIGLHEPAERLVQIQYIQETTNFLRNYGCNNSDADEIIKFISENMYKLREVSLRSAISIAEKKHLAPTRWQQMVRTMEFKREFRD